MFASSGFRSGNGRPYWTPTRRMAAAPVMRASRASQGLPQRDSRTSAPPSNTRRPPARDHTAPESTLSLAKAISLGGGRVRSLAWCSRPRTSAALLEGALNLGRGSGDQVGGVGGGDDHAVDPGPLELFHLVAGARMDISDRELPCRHVGEELQHAIERRSIVGGRGEDEELGVELLEHEGEMLLALDPERELEALP